MRRHPVLRPLASLRALGAEAALLLAALVLVFVAASTKGPPRVREVNEQRNQLAWPGQLQSPPVTFCGSASEGTPASEDEALAIVRWLKMRPMGCSFAVPHTYDVIPGAAWPVRRIYQLIAAAIFLVGASLLTGRVLHRSRGRGALFSSGVRLGLLGASAVLVLVIAGKVRPAASEAESLRTKVNGWKAACEAMRRVDEIVADRIRLACEQVYRPSSIDSCDSEVALLATAELMLSELVSTAKTVRTGRRCPDALAGVAVAPAAGSGGASGGGSTDTGGGTRGKRAPAKGPVTPEQVAPAILESLPRPEGPAGGAPDTSNTTQRTVVQTKDNRQLNLFLAVICQTPGSGPLCDFARLLWGSRFGSSTQSVTVTTEQLQAANRLSKGSATEQDVAALSSLPHFDDAMKSLPGESRERAASQKAYVTRGKECWTTARAMSHAGTLGSFDALGSQCKRTDLTDEFWQCVNQLQREEPRSRRCSIYE